MRLIFLLLFLLNYHCGYTQRTMSDTRSLLTNNSMREWAFDGQYEETLGGCKGTWTLVAFKQDGSLGYKRCINGKFQYERLSWSILPVDDNPFDWILVFSTPLNIDGHEIKQVLIDFPNTKTNKPGEKMIWRVERKQKEKTGGIINLISKG